MLVTSRTPLRVSLFGGGTDYPAYFENHPGAVVGLAIDKYIYISALEMNAWQGYNYRVAYSKLEFADRAEEIEHPVVRAVLTHYKVDSRLDINVIADLPASSGLGSSSAFSVGFVNLITSMFQGPKTKMELARAAIEVEQVLLKENVGVQDQLHTAFGGLNRFDFDGKRIRVTPVQAPIEALAALDRSMVLIHTGRQRRATDVAASKVDAIRSNKSGKDLQELYDMVGRCVDFLEQASGDSFVPTLGAMLDEGWQIKRRLSDKVTDERIDDIYIRARGAGGYGGKLCGAGGGGFVLMLIEPDRLDALAKAVDPLPVIPIGLDSQGSTIITAGGAGPFMHRARRVGGLNRGHECAY